jgi:hypothetical protein
MIWVGIEKFNKFDKFSVGHIKYDDEGISELVIANQKLENVYKWKK